MSRLAMELSAIPAEGVSRRFSSPGSALEIADFELTVTQPIELECEFYKGKHEVVVLGSLNSAVRLICSRCAEAFEQTLHIMLDAVYLPVRELSSERANELEAEGTDVYPYTEPVIDIAEMVRDRLLLSIPLQPHCIGGCKGLCPSCGVNRNTVSCQCAEASLGSPFELLKGLRFS
jgi:uncharacterized protein